MNNLLDSAGPNDLDTDAIERRAADWAVLQRNRRDWTVGRQAELDAWLSQSLAHRVAYLRIDAMWERTQRLAALRTPMRPSKDVLVSRKSWWSRIAVVVGIAAISGLFATQYLQRPRPQFVETPKGGRERLTLADGSQIELNTDTAALLNIQPNARNVQLLRGEAYFQVNHDASRPFVVTIGNHRIVDLGTKFVVRADAGAVKVTLVSGSARLEDAGTQGGARSVVLTPGEVAIDITGREWGEDRVFPRHEAKECQYSFNSEHRNFHDAVLDYCLDAVGGAGSDQRRRRLAFWGTLALMRCVGSSPAAAANALRNRIGAEPDRLEEQIFDDDADEADAVDVEPASGLTAASPLAALVVQAERLMKSADPKLDTLVKELRPLVLEGCNPVVFCRFIATAHHVAAELRKKFPKLRIEAVTGELTPTERRARVDDMGQAEQRLLVATDCLSEGINLQSLFDTVIHYDLSWNPTRHQQREGRVDRFGQPSPLVRSILLYSPDSSIDGAVLEVILRKAERIRKATGVTVPLPDDRSAVTGALMNAVLLRQGRSQQLSLDFGLREDAAKVESRWRDAEEGERRSRARFAQNALKPEEVAPEWRRWRDLLGGPHKVLHFMERALSRLDAPLQKVKRNLVKAHLGALPAAVRERLATRGLEGSISLSFEEPPLAGAEMVTRSHPLPATLAEALLEGALDPNSTPMPSLGRTGAWPTAAVRSVTTVLLLRLRYKMIVHGRRERLLLVEESGAIAFESGSDEVSVHGTAALALLDSAASGDLAPVARQRLINESRERVSIGLGGAVESYAMRRAAELAQDHARVRTAGVGVPRVTVEPVLPPDIIGLYVLLPAGA